MQYSVIRMKENVNFIIITYPQQMNKQKTWIDAKGVEVPERYITPTQRMEERNARKIASKAKAIQKLLQESKIMMVQACKEVFRNTPAAEAAKTSFTLFTFNKEFKIEYFIKENYVRVYEATKPNPSAKDYKMVDLSLNAQSIKVIEEPAAAEEPVTSPTDDRVISPIVEHVDTINKWPSPIEADSEHLNAENNPIPDEEKWGYLPRA